MELNNEGSKPKAQAHRKSIRVEQKGYAPFRDRSLF